MDSVLNQPTLKTQGPGNPVLQGARGFRVGALQYGGAPQADVRGFVTGWGKVGQSLENTGGHLSNIYQHYQNAKNVQHVADAEIKMAGIHNDIAATLAGDGVRDNPDSWPGIVQKKLKDAEGVLYTKDQSPFARQQIQLRALKWSTNLMGQTNLSRINRQFDLTTQSLTSGYMDALQNRQYGKAQEAVDNLKNYLPEDRRMALHIGIQDQVKKDTLDDANTAASVGNYEGASQIIRAAPIPEDEKKNKLTLIDHQKEVSGLLTIANDDPRRAIEIAHAKEQAGNLFGPDRVRIVDAATARLNELRTMSVKDLTSRIQMGVPDKNKIAGEILDNPNLEPSDKASLAAFLDRGPVNDPVTYAKLYAEAKNFDGKEGSPEHSRLLSRIDMTLKDDQKNVVTSALGETLKAPKDAHTRALGGIYQQMGDDLDAGLFGSIHGTFSDLKTKLSAKERAEVDAIKAEIITPAEQERLKTEPTRMDYLEGKARETWYQRNHPKPAKGENFTNHVVEDENAKRAAADRAWKVMTDVEAFQKKNPEKTPEEIKAYYESLLVRQRGVSQIAPSMTSMPSVNGLQGAPPPVSILPPLENILKKYAPNPGK